MEDAFEERAVRLPEIGLLRDALERAGLLETSLSGRTWAVFVEADAPSWARVVRALVEEAPAFHELGVHVVALATSPTEPPDGCLTLPFPVGVVPVRVVESLATVEKARQSGSLSLLVYPDLEGLRLWGSGPPAALVRKALDRVIAHRLERYRRALPTRPAGDAWQVDPGPTLGPGFGSSLRRLDERQGLALDSGEPEYVEARMAMMAEANRRVAALGRPRVFPEVLAVVTNEEPAWSLLRGIGPPMSAALFVERGSVQPSPAGSRLLGQAIEQLIALHSATAEATGGGPRWPVRRLLHAAAGVPGAFRRVFGPAVDPSRLLAARVVLPDGSMCRSFREQVRWLGSGRWNDGSPQRAWLHGAPVLANAFIGPDGVMFLQPRLVRGRSGALGPVRGDPAEDLAILLTSVDPGAVVERAVALDEPESLITVEESEGRTGPELRVTRSLPRLGGPPHPTVEQALRSMPSEARGPGWEGRFHLAAAASLFRALHGPRSVRPPAAWLATFVAALAQVEQARMSVEHGPQRAVRGH